MRKKSHILLAGYLADNLTVNHVDTLNMDRHLTAFTLGAMMPDVKPTFFVKKHSYNGKLRFLERSLRKMTEDYPAGKMPATGYWEKLGELTHFIADSFTWPHNTNFDGGFTAHCTFEGDLKRTMKIDIRRGDADRYCFGDVHFESVDEMILFLHEIHRNYMLDSSSVGGDIAYITSVTYLMTQGVLELIAPKARMIPQEEKRAS